jgi:hypothetical protein
MSAYSPHHRPRGAVARTAARTLPSFHVIVGVYFFGMGVLALILALNRA